MPDSKTEPIFSALFMVHLLARNMRIQEELVDLVDEFHLKQSGYVRKTDAWYDHLGKLLDSQALRSQPLHN